MDNSLVLKMMKKDLEEIQDLISYFEKSPNNLNAGLALLQSKINNLNEELIILKNGSQTKQEPNQEPKPERAIEIEEIEEQREPEIIKDEKIIIQKEQIIENAVISKTIEIKQTENQDKQEENVEEIIVEIIEKEEEIEEEEINQDSEITQIVINKLNSDNISFIGNYKNNISNIKSLIGINDRFLFTKELFSNNTERYNNAIDIINNASNLKEALNKLISANNWESDSPALIQLAAIIKQKIR